MTEGTRLVLITWEAIEQIVDDEWDGMSPALQSAVHSLREYTRSMGRSLTDYSEKNAALTRELEEAKEQIAGARAMMILSWPPPLKNSMPEGTLPQQLRAYIDAEIEAQRDEQARLSTAVASRDPSDKDSEG